MDVIIDEIVSTVRTVDSAALLDQRLLERLVQAVLAGIDECQGRDRRRRADARIGHGDPAGHED
jgi:hypothetical protein